MKAPNTTDHLISEKLHSKTNYFLNENENFKVSFKHDSSNMF